MGIRGGSGEAGVRKPKACFVCKTCERLENKEQLFRRALQFHTHCTPDYTKKLLLADPLRLQLLSVLNTTTDMGRSLLGRRMQSIAQGTVSKEGALEAGLISVDEHGVTKVGNQVHT